MVASGVLSPQNNKTTNRSMSMTSRDHRLLSTSNPKVDWEPTSTSPQRKSSSSLRRSSSTTRMQQMASSSPRISGSVPSQQARSRSSIRPAGPNMPPLSRGQQPASISTNSGSDRRRYSAAPSPPASDPGAAYNGSSRPRSSSTGRIFRNEDPSNVARSIMELREKRERGDTAKSSSTRRSSASNPPPPPPPPLPDSVLKQSSRYSSTTNGKPTSSRSLNRESSSSNNHHQQSILKSTSRDSHSSGAGNRPQSTSNSQRFRQAESRLEGFQQDLEKLKMKEELDELRFFAEIDDANPSPKVHHGGPPSSSGSGMRAPSPAASFVRTMSSGSATPGARPQPQGPSVNGVPLVIRAVASPPQSSRLPPPKKEILSPRKIAALDRTSLELETQTLGRQVQILEQEKANLIRTVEMYDNTCQQDTNKVRRLEDELKRVKEDFQGQIEELQQCNAAQRAEYEKQLRVQEETLESTQKLAEELEQEVTQLQDDSDLMKADFTKKEAKLEKELKAERKQLQTQATVMEVQINEVNVRVESLQKKVKAKDTELATLKEELAAAGEALTELKHSKDENYEVRLGALETQLALARDQYRKLEEENEEQTQMIKEQGELLGKSQEELDELGKQRDELKLELESTREEYKKKFTELKKTYDDREKNRLNEDVQQRHVEKNEFERRLKGLQEQLTLATDRHHAEIQQKDLEVEAKYESIRKEVEKEVGIRLQEVEKELDSIREDYNAAKEEIAQLQQESDSRAKDLAYELKKAETTRAQEVDALQKKSAELTRQLKEKTLEVDKLAGKLAETENQFAEDLKAMDDSHTKVLSGQQARSQETEQKLQEQLLEKQNELEKLNIRISRIQKEYDQSSAALEDARRAAEDIEGSGKQRQVELKENFEKMQMELIAEQAKHEQIASDLRYEVAKLEGKLKASEESLFQKRQAVDDLEERLKDFADMEVRESKLRSEVSKLREDLISSQSDFENEQLAVQEKQRLVDDILLKLKTAEDKQKEIVIEKDAAIAHLQREVDSLREGAEQTGHESEVTIASLRKTITNLQEEKHEQVAEVAKLEKEIAAANSQINELEDQLSETNTWEVQLEQTRERFKKKIEHLQTELTEESDAKEQLECKVKVLQTDYEQLSGDYEQTQCLLNDLEKKTAKDGELAAELQLAKQQLIAAQEHNARAASLQNKVSSLETELSGLKTELKTQTEMKERVDEKLRNLQEEYKDASDRLEELELSCSDRAATADLNAKRTADLQEKVTKLKAELDGETQSKKELKNRLRSLEKEHDEVVSRLQDAEAQLGDKQRQTKLISDLQDQLKEVQTQLTEKESDQESLLSRLDEAEQNLTKTVSCDMVDLQLKVQELEATKETLLAKLNKLEDDRDRKVDQVNKAAERYSKNLEELQTKLEEQTRAKESLRHKLIDVEAELTVKENQTALLSDVHVRLREQTKAKDALQMQLRQVEDELERKKKEINAKGDSKYLELEMNLEERTREKEALELKVEEIQAELARKETQITGIIERQAEDTRNLEEKLKDQTMAKASLQQEIDTLKSEMHGISDLSSESEELKERITFLEKSIETAKDVEANAMKQVGELEEKLKSLESSHSELDQKFQKVNSEKDEVIAALEDVIHEVQSRDEEIESLASILRKRDEELDHAKLIATKALASAQEMKTRYKEKGGRDSAHTSELRNKIDELKEDLEFLSNKNESLQRRTAKLEADLNERNAQIATLKQKMKINGRHDSHKEKNAGFPDGFTDSAGFALMEEMEDTFPSFDDQGSTSSRHSVSSRHSGNDSKHSGIRTQSTHSSDQGFDDAMSTFTADVGETTKGWIHDFDNESALGNRDSFDGARSEPSPHQSRRSIERDALRKYVRSRYMKHQNKASS